MTCGAWANDTDFAAGRPMPDDARGKLVEEEDDEVTP